jgi:hypothetical protein
MDVQFFVDGAQPVSQCVDADAEFIADLLVEITLGEQCEDFLARGA